MLKPTNATDIDGLNNKIITKILDKIAKPLATIFNYSFELGIFPEDMKQSKIIPIFKGGNKTSASNYRPISILPIMSKILEKLYCIRLTKYLQEKQIFNDTQYGFQKNRSTILAIIDLHETVTEALKIGDCILIVSLDLSKAFDTFDHNILLNKLSCYGVIGVANDWLRSYLRGRMQTTSLHGDSIMSDISEISCGVPQGSILGPILFILYLNDITKCSNKFKFVSFADDTTLLFQFSPKDATSNVINDELAKVSKWLVLNKL